MQAAFSRAREIAHSAVAVLGSLAGLQGLVVAFLSGLGVHVSADKVSYIVAGVGTGAAVLSKGIDSLNNALGGASAPVAGTATHAPFTPGPVPPSPGT